MKKIGKWIKKHPIMFGFLALAVTMLILDIALPSRFPTWLFFAILGAYLLIMLLTHLPNVVGVIGVLLSNMSGKTKQKPLDWAYRHGCKKDVVLATYGIFLLRDSQYEKAKEVYETLLAPENDANVEPLVKKGARQSYSLSLWKTDDLPGAIAVLEKMLEDYEIFSLDFYTTLGYFYILAGDEENGILYTDKALEQDEKHAPAYDNLGQLAYRNGDYDIAADYFRTALDIKPSMADSKYFLGCIMQLQGHNEEARLLFESADKCVITGLSTITREMVREKIAETAVE